MTDISVTTITNADGTLVTSSAPVVVTSSVTTGSSSGGGTSESVHTFSNNTGLNQMLAPLSVVLLEV